MSLFPSRGRYVVAERLQIDGPDGQGIGIFVDDENALPAWRLGQWSLHVIRVQGTCQTEEEIASVLGLRMPPSLAQVLNTLAHEIRTPLAVSQGYLKLYLDGRLTNADDQRRAFQQTREALGTLATLCNEMSKVSALSAIASPALTERVAARAFISQVQNAEEVHGIEWSGDAGDASIATQSTTDLAHAVAIVAKAAFDEARDLPHAMRVAGEGGSELVMLAGTRDAISALETGPDAADAGQVDFARGGKGLRLIWASFVLQRHHVRTWTHQGHRAAVGFRFPLVSA